MNLKDVLTQLHDQGIVRLDKSETDPLETQVKRPARVTTVFKKEDIMSDEQTQVQEAPVQEAIGIEEPAPETTPAPEATPAAPEVQEEASEQPRKKRQISEEARQRMADAQRARRAREQGGKRGRPAKAKVPGRKPGRPAKAKLGRPAKAKIASGRKPGRPKASSTSGGSKYLILYPKGRGFAYQTFDSKDKAEEFATGLSGVAAFKSIDITPASGVRFSE